MINVLSLFDGISCGQLALQRAGIKVGNYFASEVDKYAIQITQKNFPNTIQIGDVKNVKASDLPNIDLIIGGSPCQGFSKIGNCLSFDDPRSSLFFEFVRLVNECEPDNFLLENVNMKKDYMNIITMMLLCNPVSINSNLVSAQNRNRIYWGNFNFDKPKDKKLKALDVIQNDINSPNNDKWQIWYKQKSQFLLKKQYCLILNDNDKAICQTARQVKNWNGNLVRTENGKLRFVTPIECERLQTLPDNYTAGVSNTQRYKMLGNGWTVDVAAHIFSHLPFPRKMVLPG